MSDALEINPRAQNWQQHMDAWSASGLSRAQYCRDHALSYYVFNYWHAKLCKPPEKKKLVPVVVTRTFDSQPHQGLQVRLPNGVQISGIDEHSVGLMSQLIAQL